MSRRSPLWFFVMLAFMAAGIAWAIITDRNVAADAANSVAGQVKLVLLCKRVAYQMPTSCVSLEGRKKERAINAIRQASGAEPPSHGIAENEYILKIAKTAHIADMQIKCFAISEYKGFEQYFYLYPIRAGENCTGDTFAETAGSARLENFLHPPEAQ